MGAAKQSVPVVQIMESQRKEQTFQGAGWYHHFQAGRIMCTLKVGSIVGISSARSGQCIYSRIPNSSKQEVS